MIVIAVTAVTGAFLLRPYLSFEALAENHQRLAAFVDTHRLWAMGAFCAAYVTIVALSLPGATVATLTGGLLFGLWPGVALNVLSATAGAVLVFLAVRMGAGEGLARRIDASDGAVRRIMLNVSLWRFFVTTLIGIIPGGLVYTGVGSGLGTVIAAGRGPDLGVIFEPQILWPLLGLSALAALPMVLRMREAWR